MPLLNWMLLLLDSPKIWMVLLLLAMRLTAAAQTSEFLPEVDAYYKMTSTVRLWFQAKETVEDGDPVTAEFGPSLDLYTKAPKMLERVATFDLDDSKSRLMVISIGYRYLPTPDEPPTNRMEPVVIFNAPIPKINILATDRNRADLDWKNGGFTWRYRNRVQFERAFAIRSYHLSPYASAEFYYSSQYGKWSDTAIYLGALFPIGRHFQLDPYYEHQNSTGTSPNQVLNQFGLILNMFFARR